MEMPLYSIGVSFGFLTRSLSCMCAPRPWLAPLAAGSTPITVTCGGSVRLKIAHPAKPSAAEVSRINNRAIGEPSPVHSVSPAHSKYAPTEQRHFKPQLTCSMEEASAFHCDSGDKKPCADGHSWC